MESTIFVFPSGTIKYFISDRETLEIVRRNELPATIVYGAEIIQAGRYVEESTLTKAVRNFPENPKELTLNNLHSFS